MGSDRLSQTRLLTLAAMMCVISTIFQCAPFFLTEFFIFLTMFSIIPIYMISKMSPKYGMISVVVTFFIVCIVTVHEACIFMFTNGLIGLTLGFCKNKEYSFIKSICIISLCLCAGMLLLNFAIGINIIGVSSVSTEKLVAMILLASIIVAIVMLLIFKYISKVLIMLTDLFKKN